MNRVQWLAEAEINMLEELFTQPSPDEPERAAETEELRAEAQKIRQPRKRERD